MPFEKPKIFCNGSSLISGASVGTVNVLHFIERNFRKFKETLSCELSKLFEI